MKTARPDVVGFYHEATFSIAYLVIDPTTRQAAIIDPVLDYDEKAGRVSTDFADMLLAEVEKRGLSIAWILDTHPHADHFSAAAYMKEKLGAPTAIGEHVIDVQKLWKDFYNLPDFPADGSQWDRLFAEGDTFQIGELQGRVMFSPGHTLASITYVIGDAAFVHDTLFQPDFGTARADFPGGDAAELYRSIQAILSLPGDTRLFTGHDYQPGGRPVAFESTVDEQTRENIHLKDAPDEATYVKRRNERDGTLPMPKLILHALQVNIRGGRLPEPEDNGRVYLKIPIGVL
ncbi:MBL fold metallo-hydrolase [Microbaculum marinisediminis]|uniref:MBL fold metallo-hydrolase n=1 Tax=Microbaculum marinisediminis TaxID=2931392 RepID=A0AAW5QXD8_9HYPH|nr:MBL fold metallo-hydrolase [Microbaculum sp. A6E488]MCT8970955.1 MBL fold metallo-hydrolase [Microbaculum sp. A6E488]